MRLGTSTAKHVVVSTELITSMCYCWLKQQSASVPYALLRCQLYWSSSAGRERQMPRLGMYFSIFVLYQQIYQACRCSQIPPILDEGTRYGFSQFDIDTLA